ncbi:MAG: VWA domain-containing protein, partial [Chloroflexaceae bacterium]|nr:VWA domain-containing protein [Chloroflexaceae bacterium]
RITRQLRQRDIDDAVTLVSGHVVDWSGGTRIGDAVKLFNYQWARRVLGRGPVVLLISDGWDRGDPAMLSREMNRLQRSCHRLIWLNPLLGNANYQPLTLGMQAALPYVDDFLPVHNLVSLEQLGEKLSSLSTQKPARRQAVVRENGLGIGD